MPPARQLRAGLLFLLATTLGTGCDLGTKLWATEALAGGARPVAAPWVSLQLAYNRGTAFSVFPKLGDALPMMALLALLISVGVGLYVWRNRPDAVTTLALGSIVAGALGNGYDRAFRGAPGGGTGVIDFVSVRLPGGYVWPTFNVADVLLVLGVATFIVVSMVSGRRRNAEPQPSTA
ncbi:MAG: signal peptidase II [Nannocystaceae bacterium]|nr:signal peptidase II [Nannocystaceae bacterium]